MGDGTARSGHLACTEDISSVRCRNSPPNIAVRSESGISVNPELTYDTAEQIDARRLRLAGAVSGLISQCLPVRFGVSQPNMI